MRLDLVAAWVLSLPFGSTSPVAAESLSSTGHVLSLEAPSSLLPSYISRSSPQGDSGAVDPNLINFGPFDHRCAAFAVPVNAEEEYRFLISVPDQRGSGECGDFDLLFHQPSGQTIEARPSVDSANKPIWIEVEDSRRQRRVIELELRPDCTSLGEVIDPSDREAIRGTLLSVDGTRFEHTSVFHVEIKRQEQRVIDILGGQYLSNDHYQEHISPSLEYKSILVKPEDALARLPHFRDEDTDGSLEHDESGANEAYRLAEALDELQLLRDQLEEQRKVVAHLTGDKYTVKSSVIQDCDSWGCVIRKLVQKGKTCIHIIYIRVVTFVKEKSPDSPTMTAFSSTKQMKLSMDSVSAQDEKMKGYNYTLLPSIKEDYDSDSDISDEDSATTYDRPFTNTTRAADAAQAAASINQAPTARSYVTTHKIHAALGGFLSLFCLGCFTTFLHRRCCNPRAKADRAARREELRNQREYARAARQHAWKDWWAKRLGLGCCLSCGGRRDKRIIDYEEKRALIMQQENRLESYMQEEIRFLTQNATEEGRAGYGPRVSVPASRRSTYESSGGRSHRHTTRQTRANTGGSDSSTGGSLPSYRSRERSSSGRPPSYRTRASSLVQPRLVPDVEDDLTIRMANGFPYVGGPAHIDWASDGDDQTPDSSVVDVSPRLSSETIRTERSVL